MNIFERIKADHDLQRELAGELSETEGDHAPRRELWGRFRAEALAHANAEEQTLYAELIASPKSQEQARHSVSEHQEAAELIEALDGTDMSSSAWIRTFEKLREALEHHMDEEESDVFELARETLDAPRTEELAAEFDARKDRAMQQA